MKTRKSLVSPFDSGILNAVTVTGDSIIPVYSADKKHCFSGNYKVIIVNGEHGKYGINAFELFGEFLCGKTSDNLLEMTDVDPFTGSIENKQVHLFDSGLFKGNLFTKRQERQDSNHGADGKLFLFKSGGYLFGMEIGFCK